jgi:cellulase/cellobiase CelA1
MRLSLTPLALPVALLLGAAALATGVAAAGPAAAATARDQAGYLSVPSAPVRFSTSTPASADCQVSYAVTQGWGNGFVANISITNSGPDPIDGWTLAFSFPAATESISSNWNGNWTENGQAVTVTNLSWDGTLAASGGNTVDIGFVGANDGAYPSPAAFTLNGTVCTTTYSS